jgi:hypothetical protein
LEYPPELNFQHTEQNVSKRQGEDLLAGKSRIGRLPVMEHLAGISRQAIVHFTGIDPVAEPARLNDAFRALAMVFEVDLLWGGGLPDVGRDIYDWSDGQRVKHNRRGEAVVQWGIFGAAHQEDGRHFTHVPKPASVEDALNFDPLIHFPKTVEEYRIQFTADYEKMLRSCGDICLPIPHHYTTAFHWPLALFGFEMLCEVGMEEDRFDVLMQRFAEISLRITTAWSQVPGVKGFILHDDLAMTGGPIFAPGWYDKHIFSLYPRIFEPLKQAGIPIVFTSDGNINKLVDGIFAAGADGLNFEYMVDIAYLVEHYGDKILIGNMNSHLLAAGPRDVITHEVQRCLEVGCRAPRFVVNVGGQITHDIPVEHLEHYLSIRKQLSRQMVCDVIEGPGG